MVALTAEELLQWLDDTSRRWWQLLASHPEALALPCDVRESQTVAQLLQHIVAVELRYAERLAEVPVTEYDQIRCDTVESLTETHRSAMELVHPLLDQTEAFWESDIVCATRSMGELQATRRTVLVHLAMHSVRHYAQLATLLRQYGIPTDWPMDYLFQTARPVRRVE